MQAAWMCRRTERMRTMTNVYEFNRCVGADDRSCNGVDLKAHACMAECAFSAGLAE